MFPTEPAQTKNTSVIQHGRRARARASGSEQLPRGPVQLTSGQPARLLPVATRGHWLPPAASHAPRHERPIATHAALYVNNQ